MVKATAPGKTILFGEHAVVYDKLGIATAINLRVSCEVSKAKSVVINNMSTIKPTIEELMKINREVDEAIEKKDFVALKEMLGREINTCTEYIISQVLKKTKPEPFHMKNKSPLRKGMGGSASIFSAEAKAMSELFNLKLSNKEISDIAYRGDIIAHAGTPSGLDNSTVTYGGYVAFRKSKGPELLNIKSKLPLVIGDTKMPASTGQTVAMVRGFVEKGDKAVIKAIDDIDHISEKGIDAVKSGDLQRIGKLMDENQEKLRILQVSSPELEKLIKAAKAAGAYGAKLSGGGGGGIMIAICDPKKQKLVADAINRAGGEAIITEIGVEGVRIEK